jgi:hypothetical protein
MNNKTDEIIHVLNDSVLCPNCNNYSSEDNPMGNMQIEERDELITHVIYSHPYCKDCFNIMVDKKDFMLLVKDEDDHIEFFEQVNRGKSYVWTMTK